jgi:hypothetical protein
MKKVISYSLWGDNPKYTIGAIRNAELANKIYPGWISRFYVGDTVPKSIVDSLNSIPNTELVCVNENNNWTGMFWRFSSSYDSTVSVSIFRDTDSRLSFREKYAVDEWLSSDKTFHIMRDHPFHRFPILGGMWGFKQNDRYNMQILLNNFNRTNEYGTDYSFLGSVLYPLIVDDKIVHDPFFDKKDFPLPRKNKEFVGDVFDENENRDSKFYQYLS